MRVFRSLAVSQAFRRAVARRRRGVSILEVLFAILVTTIGLLGAIAVFPVASAQARKGRMADALAVAGMSAVHDFSVRGIDKVSNWVAFESGTPVSPYRQHFIDGGKQWFGGGHMVCIDPRYLAANAGSLTQASNFPAGSAANKVMDRITVNLQDANLLFDDRSPNNWLKKAAADALFMFDDDITFDRPVDRSMNAVQIWHLEGGTQIKRQSDGHMSWMATLVPKLDRNDLTTKNTYILSIVVFYDRPIYDLATEGVADSEATFSIDNSTGFLGGGLSGGEVELTTSDPNPEKLNSIRPNDWLLLARPVATTTSGTYVPIAHWYRVVDVDSEVTGNTRQVTLFGQDWDYTSTSNSTTTTVVHVKGVVGVYEKTVELDFTL